MGDTWQDKVWAAHPLGAADRLVLLAIARAVPEGATEVLVSRTGLARELEMPAAAVARALKAGEVVGLLDALQNGRVAFRCTGLPLAEDSPVPAEPVAPAVRPAPPAPPPDPSARPTARAVMEDFAQQWEARYRQRYVFSPGKDHKLAATLAASLSSEDLKRRVRAYLAHPDPYYERCAHAFGVFCSQVNKFRGMAGGGNRDRGTVPDATRTAEYLREIMAGRSA